MPRTLSLLLLALASAAAPCASARAQPPSAQNSAAAAQAGASDDGLERGKQMLAHGDAVGAAAVLKAAAERRKTDADAWYQLGLALTRAGKPKEARKAFESALKLRPDWPEASAGIAVSLLLLDKAGDAEREARRALAADPQQADAHYVVAAVRYREEKYDDALAEAEAALRANPDFGTAALLAADSLLNAYLDESERQARLYPLGPGAGKDEIRLMMEKRAPALAPFKTKMRELAERLDAFAAARPNDPQAGAWREQAETLRIYGRRPGESAPADIYSTNEVTTKAVILFKPEPSYTEEARQDHVSGVVRLRAVLGADGQVRNIVAVKRLPKGLTEKSVAAARLIRFKPATKDGRPVSQVVMLEYNFHVY
jgi:TonB family protein